MISGRRRALLFSWKRRSAAGEMAVDPPAKEDTQSVKKTGGVTAADAAKKSSGGLRRRILSSHFGQLEDVPGRWGELCDLARNNRRLDPNDPFHKFLITHFRIRCLIMMGVLVTLMFRFPEHSYFATWCYAYWEAREKEKLLKTAKPAAIGDADTGDAGAEVKKES
jgi:hypothetical protein